MSVLVAGFGNVLRGDDGFGVAVVNRLVEREIPDQVSVREVGIGGIHLVQELLEPVSALVVVDAVDVGRPPGTVLVLEPDVEDVSVLSVAARHDKLADMHYATPERALMLARGLGALPDATFLVGCQTADAERVGESLSPKVAEAVPLGAAEVRRLVTELGVSWQ